MTVVAVLVMVGSVAFFVAVLAWTSVAIGRFAPAAITLGLIAAGLVWANRKPKKPQSKR
jgi:hypothetical protein